MEKKQKTVVFLGDSLTRADYLPRGFVALLAERWPAVRVINKGVNGDTSSDLLARVGAVQAVRPDCVYLMVGANDCGWGLEPEEYRDNLRALVAALRPVRAVLITPTTSLFTRGANEPFVAAVREVASGERLQVVDFADAIQDGDYGPDGLHWNEQGHRRLADLLAREGPCA